MSRRNSVEWNRECKEGQTGSELGSSKQQVAVTMSAAA